MRWKLRDVRVHFLIWLLRSSDVLIMIDDVRDYEGAPVGLQLIGRQYEEEKILVLAEYIGAALRDADVASAN